MQPSRELLNTLPFTAGYNKGKLHAIITET
jgi:hypothetical protein